MILSASPENIIMKMTINGFPKIHSKNFSRANIIFTARQYRL